MSTNTEQEIWSDTVVAAEHLVAAARVRRPQRRPGDGDDDELVLVWIAVSLRRAAEIQATAPRDVDLRRMPTSLSVRMSLPTAARTLFEHQEQLRLLQELAQIDHGDEGLDRLERVEKRATAAITGALLDGYGALGPDQPVTIAALNRQ